MQQLQWLCYRTRAKKGRNLGKRGENRAFPKKLGRNRAVLESGAENSGILENGVEKSDILENGTEIREKGWDSEKGAFGKNRA